jgi:hypothetical protein
MKEKLDEDVTQLNSAARPSNSTGVRPLRESAGFQPANFATDHADAVPYANAAS